ncbi:MAG: deoxyribonuclease IV [Mycoplasma sp.]
MNKLILGSHVSMSSPGYLLSAIEESLEYGANTFMIYTGPPQNTIRKDTSFFKIKEAFELMKESGIDYNDVIVHAPYIINLCSAKPDTRSLAKEFLAKELIRVGEMGLTKIVLHPGSRLEQPLHMGINLVIDGINIALRNANNNVMILLETMAGKGTEVGINIDELRMIIDGVEQKEKIGVCLDTCHLWDSGIELDNFDEYLNQFDASIGLDKIKCIHINDSMNVISAHKDRHQNIGYGEIGFDKLINIIYNEKLMHVPKILETPYYEKDGKSLPPYKIEIEMIKNKEFKPWK